MPHSRVVYRSNTIESMSEKENKWKWKWLKHLNKWANRSKRVNKGVGKTERERATCVMVGGELQIVKAVPPNQCDKWCVWPANTQCSTYVQHLEREMRKTGAAAPHGLNEAQQDCYALCISPTCTQENMCTPCIEISLEVQSHFSPSQLCAWICPSNTPKHTHARGRTFHPLLHPLQSLLDHLSSVSHFRWQFLHL